MLVEEQLYEKRYNFHFTDFGAFRAFIRVPATSLVNIGPFLNAIRRELCPVYDTNLLVFFFFISKGLIVEDYVILYNRLPF